MKRLKIIIISTLVLFPTQMINARDSLAIENKKQIILLEKKIDSLQLEIVKLDVSKDYFDIIIGSQWNVFTTIIAILITVLTLGTIKFIIKDFPKLKRQQENHEKILQTIETKANESYFHAQRAYYAFNKENQNYYWSAISALRCMEILIINKNPKGIHSWLTKFEEMFDKVKDKKKFIKTFEEEIYRKLSDALNIKDTSYEIYSEELDRIKDKIKSSS